MEKKYRLTPKVNMRVMFRGNIYTVVCPNSDNECIVTNPIATEQDFNTFLEFLKSRGVLMHFEEVQVDKQNESSETQESTQEASQATQEEPTPQTSLEDSAPSEGEEVQPTQKKRRRSS